MQRAPGTVGRVPVPRLAIVVDFGQFRPVRARRWRNIVGRVSNALPASSAPAKGARFFRVGM